MISSALATSTYGDLDFILVDVARRLQPTQTEYEEAKGHYEAVTRWLEAPESIFAKFRPYLFPQGSMALLTAIRPYGRLEFDVDFVLKIMNVSWTAAQLYAALYNRLRDDARYRPMLEPKNRCVRLNFAGKFHIDIIPGTIALGGDGEVIQIPDRERRDFTFSNPEGYIRWFKGREATERTYEGRLRIFGKAAPLPQPEPVEGKSVLSIAVQLFKRRRDLMFDANLEAPSVMLTTRAAERYSGTPSIAVALNEIVSAIARELRARPGQMIEVVNPALPRHEDFAERIDTRTKYLAFFRFIETFEAEINDVLANGISDGKLGKMFGKDEIAKSVVELGRRHRALRDRGGLTYSRGRLNVVPPAVAPAVVTKIPRHDYFGD